jgi:hypothetical protein
MSPQQGPPYYSPFALPVVVVLFTTCWTKPVMFTAVPLRYLPAGMWPSSVFAVRWWISVFYMDCWFVLTRSYFLDSPTPYMFHYEHNALYPIRNLGYRLRDWLEHTARRPPARHDRSEPFPDASRLTKYASSSIMLAGASAWCFPVLDQ